jgi:hypothetical protein
VAISFPSPKELAAEAREILRRHPPKEGRDLYIWLVRQGFINADWQVTRLIGGSAEPEPDYKNWTPDEAEIGVRFMLRRGHTCSAGRLVSCRGLLKLSRVPFQFTHTTTI